MIKIAITGACGKMGRVIAGLIKQRTDCTVCAGIDLAGVQYDDFPVVTKVFDLEEKPDVIIDFSHPSALKSLTKSELFSTIFFTETSRIF